MAVHFCHLFPAQQRILQDFFGILCNISGTRAIIVMAMVGAMAKTVKRTNADDFVLRARAEANALGQLYELYYERIFRFCVHRLFSKEAAEDVTSTIFLKVARNIRTFKGKTEEDFRNWLFRIAVNQANAYIRKTSRRKKILAQAALAATVSGSESTDNFRKLDWPMLYAAILKLKPEHQTIITLRFFENLEFKEIGRILNARGATVRVTLHRIIRKLRNHLKTVLDGEK
jgi:RNA polymerase sigma-70 factor (ECF subfamily)